MRRADREDIFAAVPAAVVLAVGLLATVGLALRAATADPATLARQAAQDVATGAFETATLRYQHLMALEPDRPEHAVALADTLDRMGRRSDALAVLAAVAPAGAEGGHGPAHLKQAEWLIEARVLGREASPQLAGQARQHLNRAFEDPASRRRAAELIGILDAGG